jgi:ribosomal protein S18 acetylase RimI-like enzyme
MGFQDMTSGDVELTNIIRPASAGDTAAIAAIADATDLFPGEMAADLMAPALAGGGDLWFVVEGKAVTGFAFASPERLTEGTWNLLALAVLPKAQGQGEGSALIAAVEAALRVQGGRMLLIETLGTPDFDRVRKLYARLGYGAEAVIRDYYMPGGDKVIFRKML